MSCKGARALASRAKHWLLCHGARLARRGWRFELDGVAYPYFSHPYHTSYATERAVEVPVILRHLRAATGQRVLEVGHVLGHYGWRGHTVVDKFEVAPGVLNLDVMDLPLEPKYDLIVSISTIEHIGFDEDPSRPEDRGRIEPLGGPDRRFDPEKPIGAVQHLIELLAPGGLLVATIPLGFNPHIDRMIAEGRLGFDTLSCLERLDAANRWRQCALEQVHGAQYGRPFPCANALVVATARR